MPNFNNRLALDKSGQYSRPFAFSFDVKSAALLTRTFAPISRLSGVFQALRQRERDRVELARMSRYELHDIRVSSSDRWAEISKPFWRK
jgi:uncharacterized protein YjiS (DUF1127 family)